jgi:quercetin dioxygenase-like cupin family protein
MPSADQRHLHRHTVEVNVVLSGSIRLKIDEVEHNLRKGDFSVVWPESVVSEITTDAETEMLVGSGPSVADDKLTLAVGET